MRSHTCPKCAGAMAQGYLVDRDSSGGHQVGNWIEGAPDKRKWLGLIIGKAAKLEVQTWRCGRCGFLESYARA